MSTSLVEATRPYYHAENWTVKELVKRLGSTKAVAQEIGVSSRQVLRYLAQEEGSGKQARGKKSLPKRQEQLNAIGARTLLPERAKQRGGVVVEFDGKIGVNGLDGEYERDRTIPGNKHKPMDFATFDRLVRAAQEAGEEPAQAVFNRWYEADLYPVDAQIHIF